MLPTCAVTIVTKDFKRTISFKWARRSYAILMRLNRNTVVDRMYLLAMVVGQFRNQLIEIKKNDFINLKSCNTEISSRNFQLMI